MAYKVKGVFKGLKAISRIFATKEHEMEMEIGYPTDVKHVAHIGWDRDSAAGSASPSWMDDIMGMASSDLSSLGNFAAFTGTSSWVSQDLDRQQRVGAVSENTGTRDGSATCPDVPRPPRKPGEKKPKDGSLTAPSRPSSSSTGEVASLPSQVTCRRCCNCKCRGMSRAVLRPLSLPLPRFRDL